MTNNKFGLVVLSIVLVVQVCSTYQLKPYGKSDGSNGGELAEKGQFPHQAAIIIDSREFCGGSLISTSWVLTSAQCTYRHKQWTVILGAHNIKDSNEEGRVSISTQKAIEHPEFHPNFLYKDVGLISLPEEVVLTDQINVVLLPPLTAKYKNFIGENVRVSGWGRTSDGSSAMNPTLQYTDLRVENLYDCQTTFRGFARGSVFCCREADQEKGFNGEIGGPLTFGTNNNISQLGIASFAYENGHPTGFTAVPFYLDWISIMTGIPVRTY